MFRRSSTFRVSAMVAIAAAASLALAACGSSKPSGNPLHGSASTSTVVIGSANFPESTLLGWIYYDALKAKGVKVAQKFNIGAREVYYPEVVKGAVDIIPEYNGSLLTVSVDPTSTAHTTTAVDAALAAKLPASTEILKPSSATDSDSVTVTQAFATEHHLTSIAQLAPLAPSMVFGGPPEFKTRSDGLSGLQKLYGLKFKSFDALDESGPITLKALTDGQVQAADVFTTTPQIITDKLVSLADPKFDFAAQNVIPFVYKKAMTTTIINTLNEISAKLTTSALLQLDTANQVDHDSYQAVAQGWLSAVGIS